MLTTDWTSPDVGTPSYARVENALIQCGTIEGDDLTTGGDSQARAITFPIPFAVDPIIILSPIVQAEAANQQFVVILGVVSATGCSITFASNASAIGIVAPTCNWVAIGRSTSSPAEVVL